MDTTQTSLIGVYTFFLINFSHLHLVVTWILAENSTIDVALRYTDGIISLAFDRIWGLEKVLSALEPEWQGRGIIMEVTRLLLLRPLLY